jgi:hypothetical protein
MRSVPALFAFTDGDVWRPGIGDPTVMGWVTVAAYFGVAILCFRRARKAKTSGGTEFFFWAGLAALLVLLGINKQLDLQTFLTLTGRRIAVAQGWYEERRPVQFAFVAVVGLAALAGLVLMWRLVRGRSRELWVALLGFVLLLAFVIVRAASFHHFDALININIAGVRMNWILELGAIGLIALGTRRSTNRSPANQGSIDSSPHAAFP